MIKDAGGTVLVVDDEPSMLAYLETLLDLHSFRVQTANSGEEALARVQAGFRPDAVLLDVNMPGLDGLETLEQLRRVDPEQKVVMLSCVTQFEKVVRAMQLGARDYLAKPVNEPELCAALRKLLAEAPANDFPGLADRHTTSPGEPEDDVTIELPNDLCFVCASPAMQKIRRQATVVAASEIPVLLLGESGTGKEVVATLLHARSPRANRPFLKVNCAAVPADLLESELFGYEAGAFTGATKSKPGKFEQCNGGTIFLDEIGEMPAILQAKLLQVLQDREFSRLGARSATRVDVRVISATNINVQEAIASKKLRPDLFYRLNGLSLTLPPLRRRREEIPIFLKHFMSRMCVKLGHPAPPLTPRLLEACLGYSWPGNVRELQYFVNRYMVLADEESAIAELKRTADFPDSAAIAKGLKCIARSVKNDAEAVAIAEALRQTKWNRKEAAALLKISYKALLYKMRQFEIHPPAVNA